MNISCFGKIPCHSRRLFPVPGIRPAMCRKLSHSGNPSCSVQEAFPLRESVLQCAGSFPAPGIRPAMRRKLSRSGNPSCNVQGVFPLRESFSPSSCLRQRKQILRREVCPVFPLDGVIFHREAFEKIQILQRLKDDAVQRGLQIDDLRNVVVKPETDAVTVHVFGFNDFSKHTRYYFKGEI